jgi:hypothetical protein
MSSSHSLVSLRRSSDVCRPRRHLLSCTRMPRVAIAPLPATFVPRATSPPCRVRPVPLLPPSLPCSSGYLQKVLTPPSPHLSPHTPQPPCDCPATLPAPTGSHSIIVEHRCTATPSEIQLSIVTFPTPGESR